MANLRADLYRLHGDAFRPPDPKRLERVLAMGQRLWRQGADGFPFHKELQSYLAAVKGETHGARATETYAMLFESQGDTLPGAPLATAYLPDTANRASVAGILEEAYRRAGVAIPASAGGPIDHVSNELELLGAYCLHEAHAWRGGDPDAASRWRKETLSFLDLHFLRWFPRFRARVHVHDRLGLWAALVESTYAFATHEVGTLKQWTGPEATHAPPR